MLAATIMVPLHYAPPNTTQGVGYSMSFGIAAVLVVGLFWILRLCYLSFKSTSIQKGYKLLPSFHIRVMWRAGLTSGLLYSVGNLFGIVSINHLLIPREVSSFLSPCSTILSYQTNRSFTTFHNTYATLINNQKLRNDSVFFCLYHNN